MNTTQHPFVTRYLDDLARMLDHLPPGDRAEVLAGVREHIEAGLGERPGATDADVSAVLTELGPPEAVAREAYEEGPGPGRHSGPYAAPSPLPPAPVRTPISDRAWVPVAVAILQLLGVLMLLMTAVGFAGYTTFESGDGTRVVNYSVGSTLVASFVAFLTALPLWIGVALLAGNSALWTSRQKLAHVLLLPVSALLIGGTPELGWALFGERGLNVGAVASLLLVLGGGLWLMVRLTAVGRRHAGRVGPTAVPPGRAHAGIVPFVDRPWVPTVAALLQAVGLFAATLVGVGVTWWSVGSADGSGLATVNSGMAVLSPVWGVVLSLPFWVGVVLLVAGSTLWTRAQKWVHGLVIPVALVVVSTATFVAGAAIVSLLLLVGCIVVVTWLTMSGRRRARVLLVS